MNDESAAWSANRPLFWGFLTIALLVGGLGGWSVLTTLTGAVIAHGQVEVSQSRQVVQHPEGGVVEEILVSEGSTVTAGDVLLRLDGSQLQSELAIVENQLFELGARRARLEAERDGADSLEFPKDIMTAETGRPDVVEIVDGQVGLFVSHREGLEQAVKQRQKRIEQIDAQVVGIEAQRDAVLAEIALLDAELATQRNLLAKGLIEAARVAALERELALARGRMGELIAAIAEATGRVTEIEIEISGLSTARQETAEVELRDTAARALELAERRRAIAERIERLEIRAPTSGIVLGLKVTTPGSVVRPADALMFIVPQDRPLLVAAHVPVTHVDEVRLGENVRLVFSSLPSRTTPELFGRVTLVSADAMTDERTGASYYRAEIAIDLQDLAGLGEVKIIPGMPVDAFIRTAERTPLSYLLKPFTDYFRTAFREA